MSVLIVDDSLFARMLNKEVVSKVIPSSTIREAASGQDAVSMMRDDPAEIIFMDLNMPGITGLEASRQILEEFPDVRIAICTANIQAAIREETAELGLPFIEKPMSVEAVASFISSIE